MASNVTVFTFHPERKCFVKATYPLLHLHFQTKYKESSECWGKWHFNCRDCIVEWLLEPLCLSQTFISLWRCQETRHSIGNVSVGSVAPPFFSTCPLWLGSPSPNLTMSLTQDPCCSWVVLYFTSSWNCLSKFMQLGWPHPLLRIVGNCRLQSSELGI